MSIMQSREFKRIPIGQIAKNPNQPRRSFDEQALEELRQSIALYGVITPLTVRKSALGYELIAGERRLRAAGLAGLKAVPCYIIKAEEVDSSLMALVENLQRRDLDFFEEALSLRRLCQKYNMTQQEAADKIGKTQSAVANKLRLLKLQPETVEIVQENALTERHARALLRIDEPKRQAAAARQIVSKKLNVEATEQYIDKLLAEKEQKRKPKIVIKDLRIFFNTLTKAVGIMSRSGLKTEVDKQSEGDDVIVTIKIAGVAAK